MSSEHAVAADPVNSDRTMSCALASTRLSRHSGQATLYLSAKSDSSISPESTFSASPRPTRGGSPQVAAMQIDTESTEPDMLEGAGHLIRAHPRHSQFRSS